MSCPIPNLPLLPAELTQPVTILTSAGIEHAQQEVLDLYQWSLTQPGSPKEHAQLFQSAIAARAGRKPYAYIVGVQPFYHLELAVNPHVLIPRPETEQLVHHIIHRFQQEPPNAPYSLADIGTGSGAVALALKQNLPNATVIGTDISDQALECARTNAKKYNLDIHWFNGSLLGPLEEMSIDGLIANLPYLPLSMRRTLAPELNHEPTEALFTTGDGLQLIKDLIVQIKNREAAIRWVWLEMLPMQIESASQFIQDKLPKATTRVITAYDNQPRFIELLLE